MPATVKLGDEALAQGDNIAAAQYYEESLSKTSDAKIHATIEEKLVQVKGIITNDCLAKVANVLKNEQSRKEGLTKAISILDESSHWDYGNHIGDARKRYQNELDTLIKKEEKKRRDCEGAIREMKKFFSIYQFDLAAEVVDNNLAKYPHNAELIQAKKTALKGKYIYEKVQRQLRDGNLLLSLRSFEELQQLAPVEIKFSDIPFKYDYIEPIRLETKELTLKNMWGKAYDFVKKWFLLGLGNTLTEVKIGASDFYYNRALQAFEKERYYLAYLLSVKALSYDNRNTALFDLHKQTGDIVNKSIQQYIAIASFDSPSNDIDSGVQFSDSLTSYLYGVLPYGINILERDKIDYILKEKTEDANNLGKILGANLIVTGRVSLFQVEVNEDRRDVKARVKIGEVLQENPEYNQMVKLYGKDSATWPNIPPKTINKDQYQIITYSKGFAKLKGFAKVSVRIFDTGKAAITFVKDYPASIEQECEFHDEVPEADIEFKPKELISVIEAKASMREKIITEIGTVVQSSFDAREMRFLNEANLHMERREPDAAIVSLAKGYLYCVKSNIPEDNDAFVGIKALIKELIE